MEILEAADEYSSSIPQSEERKRYCAIDFMSGAKWALQNQWQKIERDKDGFAIDTTLADVLIMEDSGEVYINDDDDYVHNAHCRYYMTIPKLRMVKRECPSL